MKRLAVFLMLVAMPGNVLADVLAVTRTPAVGSPVTYDSADTDSARFTALVTAFSDAGAGDTLTLHGNATGATSLGKSGVTLANDYLITNTTTVLFSDASGALTFTVTGSGDYLAQSEKVVDLNDPDSVVVIRGHDFSTTGTTKACVNVNFAQLTFTATGDVNSNEYDAFIAGELSRLTVDVTGDVTAGNNILETVIDSVTTATFRGSLTSSDVKVNAIAGTATIYNNDLDLEDENDFQISDGIVSLFDVPASLFRVLGNRLVIQDQ